MSIVYSRLRLFVFGVSFTHAAPRFYECFGRRLRRRSMETCHRSGGYPIIVSLVVCKKLICKYLCFPFVCVYYFGFPNAVDEKMVLGTSVVSREAFGRSCLSVTQKLVVPLFELIRLVVRFSFVTEKGFNFVQVSF